MNFCSQKYQNIDIESWYYKNIDNRIWSRPNGKMFQKKLGYLYLTVTFALL